MTLQDSTEPTKVLARRYNPSPIMVRKWRGRDGTEDASPRPHALHANPSPAQEFLVVELRKLLLLPLDDLIVVTHEFINDKALRSGLDRCLRRHGVSNLTELIPPRSPRTPLQSASKPISQAFVYVDAKYLPQMPDQDARQFLFAAIDRATRRVYVELLPTKCTTNAFLKRLIKSIF